MPPQGSYGAPQPYQPAPPPQSYPPQAPNPNDPSRYEFFMNPAKPPRQSPLKTGSFGLKIGILVGGAALLMVIVGIILSLIPSNLNTTDLLSVAKAQNAVFVSCSDANSNAKLQDTKNFAANCAITLSTAQQDFLAYTTKHGLKINSKTLRLGVSAADTTALKASIAASTYDTTFATTAQRQLNNYIAKLKATFKTAKSSTQKKLLSDDYTGAQLLLTQLAGISSAPVN